MSQRQHSEQNYGSARSPSRTQRNPQTYDREEAFRPEQTERLHVDSPTRHDVEFYVRKVNRYQTEISRLQHDLSVAKFKLSKAQDYQIKYDLLFRQNQKTTTDYLDNRDELEKTRRQLDRSKIENDQAAQKIKNLQSQVEIQKRNSQELRNRKQQQRAKTTNQGQSQRDALKQTYSSQLQNIKKQNRDIQDKLKRQIAELKSTITVKQTIESSLSNKLEHIKKQKNSEINRLKDLTSDLRNELGETHNKNEENARQSRLLLIEETEDRISNVKRLSLLIEETLTQQIWNLNDTLKKKNEEIRFLIECDKKQLEFHQNSENSLKTLIKKLEDKVFTIQRQNQLELYNTIERLKSQYDENLIKASSQWEQIRLAHNILVDKLRKEIADQKNQINLLNSQNQNLESQHKQLAQDKQHSMQMLSQKIISMGTERDNQLKNYTTSMKQIEDDAKHKLDDLHTAILNKNTQTEILQAQLSLKNGEISHLLEQLSKLRDLNRQKLKKLESTNSVQQNTLNNEISALKKQAFQLKRNIHELENKISDDESSHQLQSQMSKKQLQTQKEANQLLKSRNNFLAEWCSQLERDLKAERVSNVNVLHDQNISQRQNVQLREEVRVELEALKTKQVEQIRSIHKLQKNRLQSELAKREHELRDKKEELGRLLVQYKTLGAKVGKSSKVDRSAEDEGKCRATLEAEILLTENIFNAINLP